MTMLTKQQWAKRAFITLFCSTIAIIAIIGICCGSVIEATLFGEIAKWALMAVIVGGIVCGIAYVPIMSAASRREILYPEYGKKWWIHDLKYGLYKKEDK